MSTLTTFESLMYDLQSMTCKNIEKILNIKEALPNEVVIKHINNEIQLLRMNERALIEKFNQDVTA